MKALSSQAHQPSTFAYVGGETTTGYKWSKLDFESSCLLRLESDKYKLCKEARRGGVREFEFNVTDECRTMIHLMNRRLYETNVARVTTFEITVVGTS
jgi:predicted secreted protein